MRLRSSLIPFALATLAITTPLAGAQAFTPSSSLPATAPTALPTANALPAPLSASTAKVPRRAEVTFVNGQLEVRADNSSLRQILRLISRQTGMKITGGVEDQRVFGKYGPASPSSILATLLDGTGTNMLLREGDDHAPLELVLTPRTGGPTPPSFVPNPADDADDAPAPPVQFQPNRPVQLPLQSQPGTTPVIQQLNTPQNNVLGDPRNTTPTASQIPITDSVPLDSLSAPSTAVQPPQGIVDSTNPPPAGSTTGTSPNGVKTPEQIYQQLLQMQQQSQPPK